MIDLKYNADIVRAQSYLQKGYLGDAFGIIERLVAQNKRDVNALSLMARVLVESHRSDEAIPYFQKCISLQPKGITHYLDLANTYSRLGRYPLAISNVEKALRLKPDHIDAIGLLADIYERAGEVEKAKAVLEEFISSGTATSFMAGIWAKIALSEKNPQEAVRALTPHVQAPRHPSSFFYTLGQAQERLGNLEESFKAYCAANMRPGLKFSLQEHIDWHARVIKTFNRQTLQRLLRPAHDTSTPIFIAGRPRSGTTLIEKIFDSHPNVTGVGELAYFGPIIASLGFEIGSALLYPEAIRDLDQDDVNRLSKGYLDKVRSLAPGAKRTVDKNLANYEWLGMISILFPKAKVINIRRQPIDNAWAIFVADMNYAWTRDLHTLGITQGLYERLMRHWHEALDIPILDVDYEAVVEDQEGWTRKILEFCELPWDDRCLRFYEESSAAKKDSVSAPTLSYNQVRQPIYKTSVNRAAKFEAFLGPLREGIEEGRRIGETLR